MSAPAQLPRLFTKCSQIIARVSLVFTVCTCWTAAYPVAAYVTVGDRIQVAYGKGSFDEAELLAQSTIAHLLEPTSPDAVTLWDQLGEIHEAQGKFGEAARDYQRALEINGKLRPHDDDLEKAIIWNDLGTVSERTGDVRTAEALLKNSYSQLASLKSPRPALIGSVLSNLGLAVAKQGRYEEAQHFYEQALGFLAKAGAEKTIDYVRALNNAALLSYDTGKYSDSISKNKQALAIEDTLPFVSADDRATTLNNLGLTLTQLGNFSEAERMFQQAISFRTNGHQRDSKLAESVVNLALVERSTGRLDSARQHDLEALDIISALPENEQSLSPTIWNNLGIISAAQKHFGDAEKLYNKAADYWLRSGGANETKYAAALCNLAALQSKRARHKEAEATYLKALGIREAALGPNHPDVASSLSNVAGEQFYLKKYDEALTLYRRAEAIEEQSLGPDSHEVARVWRNIGVVYAATNQLRDAEDAYRRAVACVAAEPATHPDISAWLEEYAIILRKEGNFGEAEQVQVRALGIRVRDSIQTFH
jgi:tetratricopeptide (TPR) repeat protein